MGIGDAVDFIQMVGVIDQHDFGVGAFQLRLLHAFAELIECLLIGKALVRVQPAVGAREYRDDKRIDFISRALLAPDHGHFRRFVDAVLKQLIGVDVGVFAALQRFVQHVVLLPVQAFADDFVQFGLRGGSVVVVILPLDQCYRQVA